jgi:hypothetical protein
MTTKSILISLCGVIVISGAIYFAMSKKTPILSTYDITPVETKKQETSLVVEKDITSEPKKNASNEEIIDYIVEGQPSDEAKAAQAEIDATSSTSQQDTVIKTNF